MPKKEYTYILGIIALYLLFRIFVFDEASSIGYLNTIIVTWVLVFLNINSFTTEQYMKWLDKLFVIMTISVFIGTIVIAIKGVTIYGDIELNERHHILNLGFFIIKYGITWSDEFVRPSGWFDEPGSLANVALLFLIYNRIKIQSKKLEYVILICGLLSLSMFFFIIAFLYVVYFYVNRKNIGLFIMLAMVALGFYLWKPDEGFLSYVWEASFGRFENLMEGDDKSRNYDIAFNAFQRYFLTGQNDEIIAKEFYGATKETLWFALANHGLLGILFFYSSFIYIFLYIMKCGQNRRDNLYLLFLFLVNLAQRPIYLFPFYMLFIYYIWFDQKEKTIWKIRIVLGKK